MSDFEFSIGEVVLDVVRGGELVVIDKHLRGGGKQYECKDNKNYIFYRMENELEKGA